ncbi:MAG: UDP-2,4-diacetamido-2,4,6-trideoxy-beta-L-altropyranose hydrolase, partial [Candidatus Heimdallarchaeota archaeon]
MRAVIRTDASSQIGIGHVMRCLTLADELQYVGCDVLFICGQRDGDMNNYITSKGLEVAVIDTPHTKLDTEYDWKLDAKSTVSILEHMDNIDWLIVDHYMLDYKWENYVKNSVKSIMVIDDLANRSHRCDLILDQNYYVDMQKRYNNLVPDS